MWATVVDKKDWMTFDASSLFPTSQEYEQKISIHHNAWTDTYLDYEMNIYFTKRAQDCYPYPNLTVNKAGGGLLRKTSDGFNFHGPVFAFCGRLGDFLGDPEYKYEVVQAHDMDMRTYADLMSYIAYYCNSKDRFVSLKGPKVTCVKVACDGERKNGVASHQAVQVPRSHPIFLGKGVSSKISEVCLSISWSTAHNCEVLTHPPSVSQCRCSLGSVLLLKHLCPTSTSLSCMLLATRTPRTM